MLMPEFYSLIPVLRVGISWKPNLKNFPKKRQMILGDYNVNILLKKSNDKVQYQILTKKVNFVTSSLSCH